MILGARLPKFGLLHSFLNKSTDPRNPLSRTALAHPWTQSCLSPYSPSSEPIQSVSPAQFSDCEGPPNRPARRCEPPRRFSPATSRQPQPRSITAVPNIISPECPQRNFTAPSHPWPHNTPEEVRRKRSRHGLCFINRSVALPRDTQPLGPVRSVPVHQPPIALEHVSLPVRARTHAVSIPARSVAANLPGAQISAAINVEIHASSSLSGSHSTRRFSSSPRSVPAPLLPAQISPDFTRSSRA